MGIPYVGLLFLVYNLSRNEVMRTRLMLIYIILLIIYCPTLYGQAESCCNCKDKLIYEPGLSGEVSSIPYDTNTYFNKNWLPGDIFLTNGEIVRNKYITYNGLLDELFCLEPKSGNTVKLDKEAIIRFHFLNFNGDTTVYFRKLKIKKDILTDSSVVFVQEIYLGKLSLYVFHTFYVDQREIIPNKNVLFEKEIYSVKPIYFLRFTDGKTVALNSLTWKNLSGLLPEKKEQIKQFFKLARKAKIELYPHMIMLMKFLNSIIDQ